MDKRISLSKEEMCNYFMIEQKIMEYGKAFFKDICACSMSTETCICIHAEVLPLSCYNIKDEYLYTVEQDLNYVEKSGFIKFGRNQASIRIGIDAENSIFDKQLKQNIRREIIHYCLWLLDLPYEEDSLEFWCLCRVYDVVAHQELSLEAQKHYELFEKLYNAYITDLPWKVKHVLTGQMIVGIGRIPMDKYSDFVRDMLERIKKLGMV